MPAIDSYIVVCALIIHISDITLTGKWLLCLRASALHSINSAHLRTVELICLQLCKLIVKSASEAGDRTESSNKVQ